MKKMMIWFVLLIILLCCGVVLYETYLAGEWPLWPQHPPQRDFSTDALLLSEEDLGAQWRMVREDRRDGDGIEEIERDFEMLDKQGNVVAEMAHWVRRYPNRKKSLNYFRSEYETYLGSVFALPEESFFQPRYADRAVLAKDNDNNFAFIAIYEEYMIEMGFSTKDPQVSQEQAIVWFREIDERAGRLLGRMP